MDISKFLVSQQTDPQSRALAANALVPGMGGPADEGQSYDASQDQAQDPMAPDGAIPTPGAPGMDWNAAPSSNSSKDFVDDHADEQQGFEDGGPVLSDKFGTDEIGNIEDRRDETPDKPGGWAVDDAIRYNIKNGLGQDVRKDDTVKSPTQAWGRTADKLGSKFFKDGGEVQSRQQRPEDDPPMDSSYRRVGDVDDLKEKGWRDRGRARYDQKVRTKPFGDDTMGGAQDYYYQQSGGHTAEFDEGGAIPDMPGAEAPMYPPEENAAIESDPRIALKAALDYGYNHHAVNRPIPDEMHGPDVQAMMHGAGATSHEQAEQALKMFGGDSAKTLSAVYDFYNKEGDETQDKYAPNSGLRETMGDAIGMNGRGGQQRAAGYPEEGPPAPPPSAPPAEHTVGDPSQFESRSPVKMAMDAMTPGPGATPGAQAAWGVLQQIRKGVGSLFGGARAADDKGNTELAAKLTEEALKRLPDSVNDVQVTPTPEGNYSVKSALGRFGVELDKGGLHAITTTPFDKAVHMGTKQLVENNALPTSTDMGTNQLVQNAASINTNEARGVRARMTQQDAKRGLSPDGSGAPAQGQQPQRQGSPAPQGQPGEQQPLDAPGHINIFRGGYGLQQVDRDGKVIYDRSDRTNPVLSHERIAAGQNQSRETAAAVTGQSRENAADILAKGRIAAAQDAGGMAKTDFNGLVQRAIKQHWDTNPPPTGPNAAAVRKQTEKDIETEIAARAERFRQQFGKQGAPGVQQGQQDNAAPAPGGSAQPAKPAFQPGHQLPKVGQIINGRAYLGGDPKKRESWR